MTNLSPTCCCVICKKEYFAKGIHSHYRITHTKEGYNKHKANSKISANSQQKIKYESQKLEFNIQKYYKNQKHCLNCLNALPYNKRNHKFCSKSCSISWSNKHRNLSEETKEKNSKSLSSKKKPVYTKIYFCSCEICHQQFIWNDIQRDSKRFCSNECAHIYRSFKARLNPGLGSKRSIDEVSLFELCSSHFNNVKSNQRIFNGWDADILIYDIKTAILWNGPWHYREMNIGNHSLKQVQNRDQIKLKEIQNAGWKSIVFEDRYFTPQKAFNFILQTNEL